MKKIILILILTTAIVLPCFAEESTCNDPLTKEQWQEWSDTKREITDPVVFEFNEIDNRTLSLVNIKQNNISKISWEQTKQLIRLGVIQATIQAHSREVILISNSGRAYSSFEPHINAIYQVAKEIDPCGRFIKHVTE